MKNDDDIKIIDNIFLNKYETKDSIEDNKWWIKIYKNTI